MMERKEKARLVGSLLESMKILDREECKLSDVGVHLSSLTIVSERLWFNIKSLLEMPAEELGSWCDDYWFDVVLDYLNGRCERKVAVKRLMDWQNDFED